MGDTVQPRPSLPTKPLGLQAQQRRPDRSARSAEAAFDPTLGQFLARTDLEPEDHLAQLSFDILHLRHCVALFRGRIDSSRLEVHDGYRFGIPKWYPQQALISGRQDMAQEDTRQSDYNIHWRRNLSVCFAGSFSTLIAMTLLLPFLPLYVEQLGAQGHAAIVQWSGIAYGATFFAAALVAPLWGRLGDRYGRKVMLVRASFGMAICMSLDGHGRDRLAIGAAAPADRLCRRLFLGLDHIGGHADAEGPLRLGARRPVGRDHRRFAGRPPARRRAAAGDRHSRHLPAVRRRHLPGLPGNDLPDQGESAPEASHSRVDSKAEERLVADSRQASGRRHADNRHAACLRQYVDRADHHRLCTAAHRGPEPGDAWSPAW